MKSTAFDENMSKALSASHFISFSFPQSMSLSVFSPSSCARFTDRTHRSLLVDAMFISSESRQASIQFAWNFASHSSQVSIYNRSRLASSTYVLVIRRLQLHRALSFRASSSSYCVFRSMGAKAKKAMKKKLSKVTSSLSDKKESADFLPLEGGPGRKLPAQKPLENTATVLYIGRIPHGFFEKEMEGFFGQFGKVKRIRIARNRKTGKSRHFGYIEFESPEVAKIVADSMHNYLLYEHLLKVHLISPEHVHPKLWKGFSYRHKPLDWSELERKQHNKERTLDEHKKLVARILKRDQARKKRIRAAGIDYECPEIVGSVQPAPKKIKFDED
ncbi:MKI67 FHA domain-interacting nucleolar phosphoprotein-like [Cucurbita pepo subsp. pepo]|uniref:MKI67 FHA domain-interacting nucleolar phosphoprotein-like n=1 Tax=Cucurbita pepo subsp. pepo TaxID=3664 RepID=UPI000C9D4D2C|nr:MKI67 FHA domain-interacting nucleolar phosphoprotein-like [Cucurbita pepo subsp. pepo]